ncbi:MAG: aspartate--ammonia ligase [Lachnospiraceae bacterium]|nr:aspartate--ammonia ligase [Lachnospiraceae bacterium]
MSSFITPKNYKSALSLHDTQVGIKTVKDYFQTALAYELSLLRVSAPAFVDKNSGLNDNLNGVERPVAFDIKDDKSVEVEVVHSLAKWKRYALNRYGFKMHEGLYTDMVAIRRDEDLDNIHSIYVDQWDWEKIIDKSDRNIEYLKHIVEHIYSALKKTEKYMSIQFDYIETILPKNIFFITSEELLQMYPNKTPKEREYIITKEHGAVFIMQIGKYLSNGERHDGRAPDYDDWELNGDILVYYPVLDIALELSSMGIRVDENSMLSQLKIAKCEERANLPFHKAIINKELPYTIGGGIGQSRICMFFLRKAHIGEIHCSLWTKDIQEKAKENGILLL